MAVLIVRASDATREAKDANAVGSTHLVFELVPAHDVELLKTLVQVLYLLGREYRPGRQVLRLLSRDGKVHGGVCWPRDPLLESSAHL